MSNTNLRSIIESIVIYNDIANPPQSFDVTQIFDELNIYENMLYPVMSGNIVITDATGFSSHMKFDGSEHIKIKIKKNKESNEVFDYEQDFVIYGQTNRTDLNQNSEIYVLNFTSDEYVVSEQISTDQVFKGTHSEIVRVILENVLKTEKSFNYDSTIKMHDFIPGTRYSPFDAIEFLTKRSLSKDHVPDFFFWETPYGFNMRSLSNLFKSPHIAEISTGAKNISLQEDGDSLYGARSVKVLTGMNYLEGIQNGMYAGRFIGYDTLTRTIINYKVSGNDVYNQSQSHANKNTLPRDIPNMHGQSAGSMYDSKVTLYPTRIERKTDDYMKDLDSESTINLDDTEYYILQRPMVVNSLLNKSVEVVMPGSFFFNTGDTVQLNVPVAQNTKELELDNAVSGKYLILMIRHCLKSGGQKHETLLRLCTDSTNEER